MLPVQSVAGELWVQPALPGAAGGVWGAPGGVWDPRGTSPAAVGCPAQNLTPKTSPWDVL